MTGPKIFFSLMNKREEKEEEEEEREEVTRGREKVIGKPIISRRPGQKGRFSMYIQIQEGRKGPQMSILTKG